MAPDILELITTVIVIIVALIFIMFLVLWCLNLVIRAAFPEWYRRNISDNAPDGHW